MFPFFEIQKLIYNRLPYRFYKMVTGLNNFHGYINTNVSDNTEDPVPTPIQNFYKDTAIFITGSTGFIGQLLLEKLLRSCPAISTIYILVRNKKGKNVQSRVDEIFEGPPYERLRKESPKIRNKVVAVEGDCSCPGLGLSVQDRKRLIDEVNCT